MTTEQIIRTLQIELQKTQRDFYPDRRIALTAAINALQGGDSNVHTNKRTEESIPRSLPCQ